MLGQYKKMARMDLQKDINFTQNTEITIPVHLDFVPEIVFIQIYNNSVDWISSLTTYNGGNFTIPHTGYSFSNNNIKFNINTSYEGNSFKIHHILAIG